MNDISLFPMQLKVKSSTIYITITIIPRETIVSQFGNSFSSGFLKNIDTHDDNNMDIVGLNIHLFKSRGRQVTFNR